MKAEMTWLLAIRNVLREFVTFHNSISLRKQGKIQRSCIIEIGMLYLGSLRNSIFIEEEG